MQIREHDIRVAIQNNSPRKKERKGERVRAAVLIPIISENNALSIILTQRTDLVEHHKNQISFPGGVVDDDDRSTSDAALRETNEELGILPSEIEVLGEIDDVTTPSGFLITPVVGILKKKPHFQLNTLEVNEAFIVPLSFFANTKNVRVETREFEGKKRDVYFYEYNGRTIWGATAFIIRLFLQCIEGTSEKGI